MSLHIYVPWKTLMYLNARAMPRCSHPGPLDTATALQVLQDFDETKNYANFFSQNSYRFIGE